MTSAGEVGPRLVVATGNAHKVEEIRAILAGTGATICSLDAFSSLRFPEEGEDYEQNAVAKAQRVAEALGEIAIADDSGLEVDALGGAPGPRSARYGGPGLDDAARAQRLLRELEGVAAPLRTARFVCAAALAAPGGLLLTARGECEGSIALAPRGVGGFGYDPVFLVEKGTRAMAELSADEKNRISHRARAFRGLWAKWSERRA